MGRRRPAEIRLDQQVRQLRRNPIEGLSPAGMRIIERLEVDRGRPGATESALRGYEREVRDPTRRIWDDRYGYGCGVEECCPVPGRSRPWLETVLRHLPPRDRRVLGALVAAIDDQW